MLRFIRLIVCAKCTRAPDQQNWLVRHLGVFMNFVWILSAGVVAYSSAQYHSSSLSTISQSINYAQRSSKATTNYYYYNHKHYNHNYNYSDRHNHDYVVDKSRNKKMHRRYMERTNNLFDIVGNYKETASRSSITISFSLLLNSTSDQTYGDDGKTIVYEDIALKNKALHGAILQATTQSLCEETTFFIASKTTPNRDVCAHLVRDNSENNLSSYTKNSDMVIVNDDTIRNEDDNERNNGNSMGLNNFVRQQTSRTKLLFDINDDDVVVLGELGIDSPSTPTSTLSSFIGNWSQVNVQYDVVIFSELVLFLSNRSIEGLSPIEIVENTAQQEIVESIEDVKFLEMLAPHDSRVLLVTPRGYEDYYFNRSKLYSLLIGIHADGGYGGSSGLREGGIHTFLQPLRISGLVLTLSIIGMVLFLFLAGKSRLNQQLWDKRMGENVAAGGLTTSQGVDAILQVGRRKVVESNLVEP